MSALAINGFHLNVAQRGDALEMLRALPDHCTPLGFFDPQFREGLDKQKYGNEGVDRQRERAKLPAMTGDYIDACCHEFARVLRPSGYLMRWMDAFALVEGVHLRLGDELKRVDLITWDKMRQGQGHRSRRCGDYVLVLQKPRILAKATWTDHRFRDRWREKVDKKLHPHVKPIGLISALIGAVTRPDDLIVDPCAGSFVVLRAATALGRRFIGCDLVFDGGEGGA
jgi:site-specific DNA-methyltransferase (adenine-specific)